MGDGLLRTSMLLHFSHGGPPVELAAEDRGRGIGGDPARARAGPPRRRGRLRSDVELGLRGLRAGAFPAPEPMAAPLAPEPRARQVAREGLRVQADWLSAQWRTRPTADGSGVVLLNRWKPEALVAERGWVRTGPVPPEADPPAEFVWRLVPVASVRLVSVEEPEA